MKYSKDKKIRRKPSEATIVRDVYRRLKADGIIAHREVPLLGRSVDLVYVQDDDLISVEFKVSNWRRAVEQAKDHRLGSDFAYICLPKKKIGKELKTLLMKSGVGLFLYSAQSFYPLEKVVDAPKSTEVWAVARNEVMSYLTATQRI